MFHHILQTIATIQQESVSADAAPSPQYLIDIVTLIRPPRLTAHKSAVAEQRVRKLLDVLSTEPDLAKALRTYLESLLHHAYHLSLYAESGVQSQHGLFSEASQKLTYLFLPPVRNADTLRGLVNMVFHDNSDYEWLNAIPEAHLVELVQHLGLQRLEGSPDLEFGTYGKMLNAILVLSHKLAAMGMESDVIVRLPELRGNRHGSIVTNGLPFLEQNQELVRFVERISATNTFPERRTSHDAEHALVMLSQCEDAIASIRRQRSTLGTSLSLTYQMERIVQHIQRLRTLIHLSLQPHEQDTTSLPQAIVRFWREVVEAENTHHSLGKHFAQNTALVAFQIAENAAKTGEHYITTTRKELRAFFTSSMGGGFIVAFLVMFKLWISQAHLPPFGEALLFSLNYGLGFIAIHLLGFKLATKQPAMTASTIAESLDVRRKSALTGEISLQNLVRTIARISRSQLASFAGNVLLALPVGCALAGLYFLLVGSPMAVAPKAHKMIAELHPLLSLSLIHAGIAGIFLFLSGLISGYYDNSVVFNAIPERIRQHPVLRRILTPPQLECFAAYIERNLGALAGNFFLGCMLGTISNVGFIFGLPLDIRHITFAAGSFALAGVSLIAHGEILSVGVICWTLVGIVGIGAMNFLVSFSLALFVAMRSRNINLRQGAELLALLARYFRSNTREFFVAPRQTLGEEIDAKPHKH
ncbi:MAG: site-specific recombinase [Candidatus Kapabacteria bacterium]|jgi:site-specific recombinase|nr:site-specific recombinase [Candidatus Kapabacteria bacterium]